VAGEEGRTGGREGGREEAAAPPARMVSTMLVAWYIGTAMPTVEDARVALSR